MFGAAARPRTEGARRLTINRPVNLAQPLGSSAPCRCSYHRNKGDEEWRMFCTGLRAGSRSRSISARARSNAKDDLILSQRLHWDWPHQHLTPPHWGWSAPMEAAMEIFCAEKVAVVEDRSNKFCRCGEKLELVQACPSSDNLRLVRRFEKGGSGSSGLEFKRPAADAASGGLRWLYA